MHTETNLTSPVSETTIFQDYLSTIEIKISGSTTRKREAKLSWKEKAREEELSSKSTNFAWDNLHEKESTNYEEASELFYMNSKSRFTEDDLDQLRAPEPRYRTK